MQAAITKMQTSIDLLLSEIQSIKAVQGKQLLFSTCLDHVQILLILYPYLWTTIALDYMRMSYV